MVKQFIIKVAKVDYSKKPWTVGQRTVKYTLSQPDSPSVCRISRAVQMVLPELADPFKVIDALHILFHDPGYHILCMHFNHDQRRQHRSLHFGQLSSDQRNKVVELETEGDISSTAYIGSSVSLTGIYFFLNDV